MASSETSRLARILIDLSDRPNTHWASSCGFEPANLSNWLRGREISLSEKNISLLLSALSIDPDRLSLDPSRIHVWFVAIHEPETLTEAAEAFLGSEIEMALVSPDPEGPATLSQGPQMALLRSGNLRVILVRKFFTTKMSENHVSKRPGTPWIRPSLIPGARWKAPEILPTEDAPPILLSGPVMMDFTNGHVTPELFDRVFDQAQPGDWKDVEALAKKSGLTAREVLEMIRTRISR
ncbi:MAG: hypothetical protein M1537_01925 [Nitrospirae bacterium]|nr:hypothetical protein [Nitrospirota bacterium]MCL5284227.1 hypothetical protein [Nitrospirota bacterium]